jgi:hypothetical protein
MVHVSAYRTACEQTGRFDEILRDVTGTYISDRISNKQEREYPV